MSFLRDLFRPKSETERAIKRLRSGKWNERRDAADTLGRPFNQKAVEPLIHAALNDEVADVRWHAAEALGKTVDHRAVAPLAAILRTDPSDLARLGAADGLGYTFSPDAVEPLIEALSDPYESVRIHAAESLGKLRDPRAIEYIRRAEIHSDYREGAIRKIEGRIDADAMLSKAVDDGDLETARNMIEQGADVNAWRRPSEDYTNLFVAADTNRLDMALLLLDTGAKVDLGGRYIDRSPLMAAASRGHFEVVRLLISKGARVSYASDYHSKTALMLAAFEGHGNIVEELLDAGADVSQRVGNNNALLNAISGGRESMVSLLLKRGADRYQKIDGRTPREFAELLGKFNIAEML